MYKFQYFILIFSALIESLLKVKPDFIIYNAGTDILKGDKLGLLSITPEASFHLIFFINLDISMIILD